LNPAAFGFGYEKASRQTKKVYSFVPCFTHFQYIFFLGDLIGFWWEYTYTQYFVP
jgi:hypothetical protein